MKSKVITGLKKEVLVIELPENTKFDVLVNNPLWKDGIKFLTGTDDKFHFIKGSFTLLGKPDEIKDEYVKEFVDKVDLNYGKRWCAFENYIISGEHFSSALASFHSALESEIYWVNPLNNKLDKSKPLIIQTEHLNKWKEAQEKTFDRNRTLIFVNN